MKVTPELLEKIDAGQVDLVSLLASDQELYAQLALKIQTKSGDVVPFVFNDAQQIFHKWCEDTLAAQEKIRCILLKARQWGGTTYVGARIFHKTATRSNQKAKIIAQSDEKVMELLQIYTHYYTLLPESLKPMKKYMSKTSLNFSNPSGDSAAVAKEPGLNSSIGVYSAKSKSAARGSTIRLLHCSEVAFWEVDVPRLMLGTLNTVPNMPGTEVFLESTANGMGDYFHKKYLKARAGEDGDWRACFIPWYVHNEYRAKHPASFEKDLNKKERDLFTKEHPRWQFTNPANGHKRLTLEQLFWRRIAIATLCDGDERQFQQEYPLTDDEAFVTSGATFFSLDTINARMGAIAEKKVAYWRGEIEEQEAEKDDKKKSSLSGRRPFAKKKLVRTEDLLNGRLTIFEEPAEGQKYVWFADAAEGVQGGDPSEIHVLNQRTGNQAAVWRGIIEPDTLGDFCYMIGRLYFWAKGSPECNNHGLVTLMTLKERRYPFLYRRQVYDQELNKFKEQEGWMTTKRTRPVMLEALRANFRDGGITINDQTSLEQMQTFSMIRGKLQAQEGAHDDAVMGMAGACQMKDEIPLGGKHAVRNYLDGDQEKDEYFRKERVKRVCKEPRFNRFTGALED